MSYREPEDLTGQIFERLVVVAPARPRPSKTRPNGISTFTCQCECMRFVDVLAKSLKNGNTRSCGCLKKDLARAAMEARHAARAKR